MPKKLYTIKDIVELLNNGMEKNELSYRYTEQSVRSRLRYLQGKGVENHDKPIITPKVLGYDRRTKYYTEEDVEKVRGLLMSPMLPEFHDYKEDLPILEEVDEITVRPAILADIEAIAHLNNMNFQQGEKLLHDPIYRMLKEPNSKIFGAFTTENQAIGLIQAKISFALTVASSKTMGTLTVFIDQESKFSHVALRSLIHRAIRWHDYKGTKKLLLEMPASMKKFEEYLQTIFLPDSVEVVIYHQDTRE